MIPLGNCADAYRAWADGNIPIGSLDRGAIVLADGTRCPAAHTPEPLVAEVTIPAGQPSYVPPDIGPGMWWVWPVLAVGMVLCVALMVGMVWIQRWQDRA